MVKTFFIKLREVQGRWTWQILLRNKSEIAVWSKWGVVSQESAVAATARAKYAFKTEDAPLLEALGIAYTMVIEVDPA